MNRSRIGYTVVFTFVLTFVLVGILTIVHGTTVGRVDRNEIVRYQRAVERAVGIGTYVELYAERSGEYRIAENGREIRARAFSGAGVWGDIHGVIAVDVTNRRVIGVEIIEHNETPGLGGRIAEDRFLRQLRGETVGENGIDVVVRGPGNSNPEDATIDGITGATGTTRAFARILNQELQTLMTEGT